MLMKMHPENVSYQEEKLQQENMVLMPKGHRDE
jgi:hypothetical protein